MQGRLRTLHFQSILNLPNYPPLQDDRINNGAYRCHDDSQPQRRKKPMGLEIAAELVGQLNNNRIGNYPGNESESEEVEDSHGGNVEDQGEDPAQEETEHPLSLIHI